MIYLSVACRLHYVHILLNFISEKITLHRAETHCFLFSVFCFPLKIRKLLYSKWIGGFQPLLVNSISKEVKRIKINYKIRIDFHCFAYQVKIKFICLWISQSRLCKQKNVLLHSFVLLLFIVRDIIPVIILNVRVHTNIIKVVCTGNAYSQGIFKDTGRNLLRISFTWCIVPR